MKLYVIHSGKKIYMHTDGAPTRNELAHRIGRTFTMRIDDQPQEFNTADVKADMEDNTITGMVVGSIMGLVAGPIGLIIFGLLGYILGLNINEKANREAKFFNESKVYINEHETI